jgi:RNA polymerase sigma-70 factor, ECF subfamily
MSNFTISVPQDREPFDRILVELRPKLHRYCAWMVGSVIDGEDVLQQALIKAIEAVGGAGPIAYPQAWLFQVAHNTALDYLRRRSRQDALHTSEDPDTIADEATIVEDRLTAAASLRSVMRLAARQRSCVILMDVLGYSLEEIGAILGITIPAIKAALYRGRARLRELAREPNDPPPAVLAEPERSLLARYVDSFNARDFDAIRDMLADEVRLELVNRRRMNGRSEVANYYNTYGRLQGWHARPGFVEGRPALIVTDPHAALIVSDRCETSGKSTYFIQLQWSGDRIVDIRDFYFARYATADAELSVMA